MRALLGSLACLILSFAACTDSVSPPDLQSPVVFSLNFGGTVSIDDGALTISFTDLVGDSRCPTSVVCVWEGQATIGLRVQKKGEQAVDLALGVSGAEQDTMWALNYAVDTLGYRFSLRSLSPYPEDPENPTPISKYVARLRISRLVPGPQPAILTSLLPGFILLGEYEVDSSYVDDEELFVRVRYGGGCADHDFNLFMDPDRFMDPSPVKANLILQHVDHFDACRAYIREWVSFDISPIAEAFRSRYHSGGTVQLDIYEYDHGDLTLARSQLFDVQIESR